MPAPRFKIRRTTDRWVLLDRFRPGLEAGRPTHALAVLAMDNRVRFERGMPARIPITSHEILERMSS